MRVLKQSIPFRKDWHSKQGEGVEREATATLCLSTKVGPDLRHRQ